MFNRISPIFRSNMGIEYRILSVPLNIIMDLNNVMQTLNTYKYTSGTLNIVFSVIDSICLDSIWLTYKYSILIVNCPCTVANAKCKPKITFHFL